MENSLIESVKALLHNAGLMRQVTENPNSLLAEHYNRICSLLEEKPPLHVVEPPSSPTATAEEQEIILKFLDWYDGDLGVLKDHNLLIHEYFTERKK